MLAPCIIFSLCSPGWPGTRYDPPGSQTRIELDHLPPSNFSGSLSPMRRGVERQALVALINTFHSKTLKNNRNSQLICGDF